MKIVAQKTDFYLSDEFFADVIQKDYVDGVCFNVVFNKEQKLFVYNYTMSGFFGIQKIQDSSLETLEGSKLIPLEEALLNMQNYGKDLSIYLNVIPVSIDIIDDASLKHLNALNSSYILALKKVLEKYQKLDIGLHSISRNLTLSLQESFPNKNIGYVVYTGDLTPTDVNYYVFPTYMIDNLIFEELIDRGKGIYIFAGGGNDLSVIIDYYDSAKSTALSSKVLPDLNFIVNYPNIMSRILPNIK